MQTKSILFISTLIGAALVQAQDDVQAECKKWGDMVEACPAATKIFNLHLAPGAPTPAALLQEQASCECYDDSGKWIPDEDKSIRSKCMEWAKTNNPMGIASDVPADYVDFCSSVGDVKKASKTGGPASAAATETGAAATGTDAGATGTEASGTEATGDANASGSDAATGTETGAGASGTGSSNSTSDATLTIRYGAALGLVVLPVLFAL